MNKHNIIQILLCHILRTVSVKVYSVIPFSRNSRNTKTSQLIWNANKFTDLYTIRVTTVRYFGTSYNNPPITHPLSHYNNKSNSNNDNEKMSFYYKVNLLGRLHPNLACSTATSGSRKGTKSKLTLLKLLGK